MCLVHLVPLTEETRVAKRPLFCVSCRGTIRAGEEYRHVEGRLDDGSHGRWRYLAHEDCYLMDYQDTREENDGCFVWTGAERMEPCPRCGSEDVRRITETDLACEFCGHEFLDPLPPEDDHASSSPCESPEDVNAETQESPLNDDAENR